MSAKSNPLIMPILAILRSAEQALSEYELIGELQQRLDDMDKSALAKPLALFPNTFPDNECFVSITTHPG